MEYFLIDNGSLRPGSVLQMRKIAQELSQSSGHRVRPFGLMHSHKIDPNRLDAEPGASMQDFLASSQADTVDEIRALPFFLGPSLAITDWLPENLQLWKDQKAQERKFRILKPLYQPGDDRLVRAISELCHRAVIRAGFTLPYVALVDHGTPLAEVNQVRENVGREMEKLIGSVASGFSTCAMERRPDPQYDFNDPLLENLLARWVADGAREIVVSQFFLLPGRHAGPDGDLAEICQPFEKNGVRIERSENLGDHSLIKDILLERIRTDLQSDEKP
jgi:sirohydrochlorin ferrochelatase